jgi:hypothetical protein
MGLIGGVGNFKSSQMSKDLRIGINNKMATWASGLPASAVSRNGLTPAILSRTFSITPSTANLANAQTMSDAANAASDIAEALGGVLGNSNRNGATALANSAGCAIKGNAALADPNFGTSLFTPTGITALTNVMNVASLTATEQAQLAAYYQSAKGVIGGVMLQYNGRDYHGQNPATVIAPADIEFIHEPVAQ